MNAVIRSLVNPGIRLVFLGLMSTSSFAQTNEQIASTALQHVGEKGGQCKAFLRQVLNELGTDIGPGYRQAYLDIGKVVNSGEVVRGDVMQIYSPAAGENQFLYGYHTAIVLGRSSDGTFEFVGSNWCQNNCEIVSRHSFDPFRWAANNSTTGYTLAPVFYRLGRVSGAAIGQSPNGAINQKFVDMAQEIATAYRIALSDITTFDNGGSAYVHEWVKSGDRLVVQDVRIRNAGLTHPQALLVLAGDGSRVYVVKEGFYWLFMQHDTGMPFGNEELSGAGNGQVYQRFERAMAYWDNVNKVLTLKDYAQTVIAQYTNPTFTIATGGDGTVVLDEPAPDQVIPLTGVTLVIMPAELGYRYQLSRGQERMTFNLQLNHAGGNPPLTYRFYKGDALISQGANPFCSVTLTPGTHVIRARVEAGSGNTLQSQEASRQVVVEAAPKSDWNVPFDVEITSIARDGERLYVAGRRQNGTGYLYQARRDAPANGQHYTFGFSFNEILPMREYVFAATSSGLMVSMVRTPNF